MFFKWKKEILEVFFIWVTKESKEPDAEDVVFIVAEFSSQVIRDTGYRDRKQKRSRKTIRDQNQKSDWRRYQGAGRNRSWNKQIRRQMGKQIQRGRQKSKIKQRVSQQYLNNLAYRYLGTENYQCSDGLLVHGPRYIYTGKYNTGSRGYEEVLNNLRERK